MKYFFIGFHMRNSEYALGMVNIARYIRPEIGLYPRTQNGYRSCKMFMSTSTQWITIVQRVVPNSCHLVPKQPGGCNSDVCKSLTIFGENFLFFISNARPLAQETSIGKAD